MKRLSQLVLMLLLGYSLLAVATPLDESSALFKLMNQRLVLMKAVAAYKYQQHIAIDVPIRERVELVAIIDQAERVGLDDKTARQFFITQIMLAKHIELAWFKQWDQQGFPADYKALDLKQVRSQLDQLNSQIVDQVVKALPALHDVGQLPKLRKQILTIIDAPYVDKQAKLTLLNSVRKIILQPEGRPVAG